jgi:hypothetical protein
MCKVMKMKEGKHAIGRPRKFKSVEDMERAIQAYFDECDARKVPFVTKNGDVVMVPKPKPYSMGGLAETLGIVRRTLVDYKERCDEFGVSFLPTITRARARVERNLEERLYDGDGSDKGNIFGLKNNYGWKDGPFEVTGAGGGPLVVRFDKEDANL